MAPSAFDRAQIFLVCQTERTVEMAARDNWSGPWRPTQPSLICWGGKNVSHGLKIREQKKSVVWSKPWWWHGRREWTDVQRPMFDLWLVFLFIQLLELIFYLIHTSSYAHVFCAVYFTLVIALPVLALQGMVQAPRMAVLVSCSVSWLKLLWACLVWWAVLLFLVFVIVSLDSCWKLCQWVVVSLEV